MKTFILAASLAATLFSPLPVFAKAHHTPMRAPIDCHGNFDCLHAGYVTARLSLASLVLHDNGGSKSGACNAAVRNVPFCTHRTIVGR